MTLKFIQLIVDCITLKIFFALKLKKNDEKYDYIIVCNHNPQVQELTISDTHGRIGTPHTSNFLKSCRTVC